MTAQGKASPRMKTNQTPQLKRHETGFLATLNHALYYAAYHSFWTPEKDEKRFLFLLGILMYAVMPLWGKGLLKVMGPCPPLTVLAVGWIVYLVRFWTRLRDRGELKFVLIAPTAYFALLLLGMAAASAFL